VRQLSILRVKVLGQGQSRGCVVQCISMQMDAYYVNTFISYVCLSFRSRVPAVMHYHQAACRICVSGL